MKVLHHLLLYTLLIVFWSPAMAQTDGAKPSLFQHFNQMEGIPTLTLKTDTKQLIRKKMQEEYQDGYLAFPGPNGSEIEMQVEVRSRGNMRKQVCYYPPLKIDFDKSALDSIGFDTLDKLKFVIQCKKGKTGEKYLFTEHLIYQFHKPVGPISYLTKLVKIDMVDDKGKVEPLYGFLIEEEEEFARRMGGPVVEVGRLPDRMIDRDAYLKMVFFQYLILNTDWFITNKHNLEFVRPDGEETFYPVPYDFDYAGLVGTTYAVPHPSRGISSVKEAKFLGEDVTMEEAQKMAEFFSSIKSTLYEELKNYPYLDEKEKKDIEQRLDDFYEEMEDEKRLERNFVTAQN